MSSTSAFQFIEDNPYIVTYAHRDVVYPYKNVDIFKGKTLGYKQQNQKRLVHLTD